MTEAYPQIDPTTFDLIIVGTGLPESLIAAAASAAGKSVLHLDPNPFYGSHFASLGPDELSAFLSSSSFPPSSSSGEDPATVSLTTRPLYSNVEISSLAPETLEEHARKFNLDVAGPRVLFCADRAIDAILKWSTNHYLEFKAIDANFICVENGKLMRVPDSRSAIFKDKNLSLIEKNQLMKFLKIVQRHLDPDEDASSKVSQEDLESPFAEFLAKIKLPPKIKSFPNSPGALIYPSYGQGELPQAFCRRAAVKRCLYVLRMPVVALLIDEENGQYRGIRLASGQDLFSPKLILDPSFVFPSQAGSSPEEPVHVFSEKAVEAKVARGICITRSSLKPDISNLLVVYPPRSLYPEQDITVRVLQLGSTSAICPPGMFVLYLSALCNDATQGKKLLNTAISAIEVSQISERNAGVKNEDAEVEPPFIIWKAIFIQELSAGKYGSICSTPSPDGNLNYHDLVDAAEKLFHATYPDEAFFPETASPENADEDNCPEDDGPLEEA
ncbi:rab escort protein 1 isoform X2 [Punica granatum]|uniref:Rab escort protein 1 isoform X2 n=1 Tax=Punica granatum TaxID=22663 RepID=A0A6P8CVK3_PUNGR|nr:rab escort protein 1 isoform X2 [Punica granatum]